LLRRGSGRARNEERRGHENSRQDPKCGAEPRISRSRTPRPNESFHFHSSMTAIREALLEALAGRGANSFIRRAIVSFEWDGPPSLLRCRPHPRSQFLLENTSGLSRPLAVSVWSRAP
jgi:hypothetical protein